MKKLLLVIALASGCATTPERAGAREVAVGGGLVAVGSVGATGTIVATAVLLAQAANPSPSDPFGASRVVLRNAAPSLAIAAAVDVVIISGGVGLIALGEATIDEARAGVTSTSMPAQTHATPSTPSPKKTEPERRTDVAGGRLTLIGADDAVDVAISGDVGQCAQATFIIDGRETALPMKAGRFRLPRSLGLVSAQFASLNLCRTTIDLSIEERAALDQTKLR
jgi:hypothetical protein